MVVTTICNFINSNHTGRLPSTLIKRYGVSRKTRSCRSSMYREWQQDNSRPALRPLLTRHTRNSSSQLVTQRY